MKFEDIEVGDKLVNRYTHEDCVVTELGGAAFSLQWPDGQRRVYMANESERFSLKIDVPVQPEVKPCGSFGCTLGAGHNMGRADVPANHQTDPLAEHAAVVGHGYGVSSDDLASFVESLASLCVSRIQGTGKDQYERGNRQEFEDMTDEEMVTGFLEEAADAINYISMAAIKFLSATQIRRGW